MVSFQEVWTSEMNKVYSHPGQVNSAHEVSSILLLTKLSNLLHDLSYVVMRNLEGI